MITNNQNAINILKQDQLNMDESFVKVLPNGEELTVTSLSMLSKGTIYTSVMKNLEVTVRGDKSHLVDKWLHLTRYVGSANVNNGNVEVLDYGMIAVESYEYDEVADTTTLNCFDGMLLANQSYNADMLDITFPNTVRNVVLSVARALNLETDINIVPNLDYVVDVDYWANDLSYTFRDILNHMAQITTSTIAIRDNKLTMFEPSDTGLVLEGLNQVLFNGVFGKTNIMAISQQPQNDNFASGLWWKNIIPENARQFESPPWYKNGGAEVDVTPAPMAVFDEGYSRNLLKNTSDEWTELDLTESQWYFQQGSDYEIEIG